MIKIKSPLDANIKEEKSNAALKFINNEISYNDFLENQLSRMFSGITMKFNNKYDRVGPLFKQGVKRIHIKTEHRLIYIFCYIHHNPIHHGICNKYESWEYSSYKWYFTNIDSIIDSKLIMEIIGDVDSFNFITSTIQE